MSNILPSHFYKISGQPGPNVVVLGGVHGDEKVGVELIKKLCNLFNLPEDIQTSKKKVYKRNIIGNLYLGVGNPKAVDLDRRGVSEFDLNRCFVPERLQNPKKYDHADYQRARELVPLFKKTDYLIDIHSTTSPSRPFVCLDDNSPDHEDVYSLTSTESILLDPREPSIISKPFEFDCSGTTDYFVNKFGGSEWSKKQLGKQKGVGFCYETGQFDDFSKVNEVFETVKNVLNGIGVLDLANEVRISSPDVYRLNHCELAESVEFEYVNGMDQNWKPAEEGEVIGRYKDLKKNVCMPTSGIILFPRHEDKIRYKGDSLFCVAEQVS